MIFRLEGGVYRFAAGYSLDPAYLQHERRTPISPGPGTVVGRAAMSREVVQIEDAWTDPLYEQKAAVKISGGRSMIGVPLMREGEPIGVIGLAPHPGGLIYAARNRAGDDIRRPSCDRHRKRAAIR